MDNHLEPSTAQDPIDTTTTNPPDSHETAMVRPTTTPTEQPQTDNSSLSEDKYKVTLDDEEDPLNTPVFQKWVSIAIIASAATCVTCASSVASYTQKPQQKEWHVSSTVTILAISLFVEGLGIGPLLLGPMSEFYGRNKVYWTSFTIYILLTLPVALAPDISVFLVFRFLTGFSGSAFLSVAGGSVTDLFRNENVALPMAVYSASPFMGPVLGPAISGFINQNTNWRWTYWTIMIWTGVELALLVLFVPETHRATLEKRKAQRIRKQTGDPNYYSALEKNDKGVFQTIQISCSKPFLIMYHEPMALALNIWSALLLGVLYLTFEAFPTRVFNAQQHFNTQISGLSFLGIGLGMLIGILSQPYWVKVYLEERVPFWEKDRRRELEQKREVENEKGKGILRKKTKPEPETRLLIGMAGAVLVPIGLFWFAFTTPHAIHWIVPMLATIPFGTGVVYAYIGIWSYLVDCYRPHAASAMAGNSFVRSAFAAVFPLFATAMYVRLGVVGATGLLAGLTLCMTPLPFLFYHYGRRLRKNSRFVVTTS
ncbi:hypothetical protein FRB94_008272 [Tulasnella sp. JGI-2019a]|nr:hypothetical protein FRB94_008272 [Tulasnella sp. JGI-2019a]